MCERERERASNTELRKDLNVMELPKRYCGLTVTSLSAHNFLSITQCLQTYYTQQQQKSKTKHTVQYGVELSRVE